MVLELLSRNGFHSSGYCDRDLWPTDPKIYRVFILIRAITLWSLKVLAQRVLELLSGNGFYSLGHCDLDLWPTDPKINRGLLLNKGYHHMKFEGSGSKGTRVIERKRSVTDGQGKNNMGGGEDITKMWPYVHPGKTGCDLMSTLAKLDVTICQPWQNWMWLYVNPGKTECDLIFISTLENWMWPYVHPGKTGCDVMSTLAKLDVTLLPALSRMAWDQLSSSQHPTHPVMGFRGTLMTAWFFLFRPFGQPPAVLFNIFLSWITETQS